VKAASAVGRALSHLRRRRRRRAPGWLSELFLTVSGANRDILRQAPKERTKQVAMGIVLASTAAVAAVSATYALGIALHLWLPFALLGGLVWGLIILNLDRWLVVSTPRLKRWWSTVLMALPRLVLALLIGAVVSTPLTLAVFESEINAELEVMQAEAEDDFTEQLAADSRFVDLPAKRERMQVLETELVEKPTEADVISHPAVVDLTGQIRGVSEQYAAAEAAAQCETDGTCGTGDAGIAAAAQTKWAYANRLRNEKQVLERRLDELKIQTRDVLDEEDQRQDADANAELSALAAEVADAEEQRDQAVAAHRAEVGTADGLLARLEALHRLGDANSMLATAHQLLFAFMTAIECLPILFKTMLALAPPSLYERLLKLDEEKLEERVKLRLQSEYEEADVMVRSALAAAEARAARTLEAESRATGMVLKAQLAVTREHLRRWRDEQLRPDSTDPDAGTAPNVVAVPPARKPVDDLTDEDLLSDLELDVASPPFAGDERVGV
jgi:hypothetical protein